MSPLRFAPVDMTDTLSQRRIVCRHCEERSNPAPCISSGLLRSLAMMASADGIVSCIFPDCFVPRNDGKRRPALA
ncbi:MAG: hypothetical protein LBT42_03055 [Tannerella sp.]|nr:hypothetical protein [Tannerella sp.]